MISTFAPASSSFFLTVSASSLVTPSLTALGALSTNAFASVKPRLVSSRTALMTLIFSGPISERTTSNSVFSASGAAAPGSGGHHRDRSGRRDAVLLLELLYEIRQFENGELIDLFDEFGKCHDLVILPYLSVGCCGFFLLADGVEHADESAGVAREHGDAIRAADWRACRRAWRGDRSWAEASRGRSTCPRVDELAVDVRRLDGDLLDADR